jgi:TetR/AcrR family transcriptional repressor of lmrAB and yxaGH operons
MYHFFPDGKEQLAEEVIRYGGELYAQMIRQCFAPIRARPPLPCSPAKPKSCGRRDFAWGVRWRRSPSMSRARPRPSAKPCADVFATWINALAEGIAASGTPRETATDLASYILASLEGAIILSRTSKSVKPLEQTAQFVLRTIQETIRETIEEKLPRLSHKAKGARSGTRT